jgi:hypothetical protein
MTAQDDAPNPPVDPNETSIQRAFRLKQEMIGAREKPPRGGRFQREQANRVKSGAVRPWTHK